MNRRMRRGLVKGVTNFLIASSTLVWFGICALGQTKTLEGDWQGTL